MTLNEVKTLAVAHYAAKRAQGGTAQEAFSSTGEYARKLLYPTPGCNETSWEMANHGADRFEGIESISG